MISKTQRQYLKSLANNLKPLVTVGKNGLTEALLESADEVLSAHELLKINILKSCESDCAELALDIASKTNSEIISQLGRKVVLYRKSKKESKIQFPK